MRSGVAPEHEADRSTLIGRSAKIYAGTQRLEPTRGRDIGWNPKPVDIKKDIRVTVDAVVEKMRQEL